MRAHLFVATALLVIAAASSPCKALQVTISSAKASFVQGEPIYVWVDYYNDKDEAIGLPAGWLFGFEVLTVRTQDGTVIRRPGIQLKRPPLGGNQIQRIGPRGHYVFFADLLEQVNLTEPGSYSVQIATPNHSPELFLDRDHPAIPASQLIRGPIESNRWQLTIAAGSGDAFDLIDRPLREKTAGTFALCPNARTIVEKYSDSVYGPYAALCQIDDLLYAEERGPVSLKDRLATAQALLDGLRGRQTRFEYLDIALIRYAERLVKLGQDDAASLLLNEVRRNESNVIARIYIANLRGQKSEEK